MDSDIIIVIVIGHKGEIPIETRENVAIPFYHKIEN